MATTGTTSATFFSYSRKDSEFAARLARDLKAAGADVWFDQIDIEPGMEWDRAVEEAVKEAPRILLILSPASVNSRNVRDEISFALQENKTIIPVLYQDCSIPLRLGRIQHVDLRTDYAHGLEALLKTLRVETTSEAEKAQKEADAQAKAEAERKAKQQEAERARQAAEAEKAQQEAEARARAEAERRAQQEAEEARQRAEAQQEAEAQAKAEEERKRAAVKPRTVEGKVVERPRETPDWSATAAAFYQTAVKRLQEGDPCGALAAARACVTSGDTLDHDGRRLMDSAWCPRCNKRVREPSFTSTAAYSRFWRGECPICLSPLVVSKKNLAGGI
ncbi:MAG: toll/interleukin-1 receptor domain-containing protein [Acidobacteriia bacterium]|nr:toll/interleukin-1 receptor domain-containing protein [Terriglobia bacterium]